MRKREPRQPTISRFWKIVKRSGVVLFVLAVFACFGRVDGFTLSEWWRDCHSGVVVWQGTQTYTPDGSPCIALTIDDGPDPRYTPQILAILQRYHAKATFFVEGRYVRAHPELARAILGAGTRCGQPHGHAPVSQSPVRATGASGNHGLRPYPANRAWPAYPFVSPAARPVEPNDL